jgi:hypothetical protein
MEGLKIDIEDILDPDNSNIEVKVTRVQLGSDPRKSTSARVISNTYDG